MSELAIFAAIISFALLLFYVIYHNFLILPEIDSLTWATLILAIATIVLAFMTYLLAKDSSKNIKLSKENLIGQHLLREMDQLIKPLYENRNNFEELESCHEVTPNKESFWKKRESDKYLAPKDLRHLIEEYLGIDKEMYKRMVDINNDIWEILDHSPHADKYRDLKSSIYSEGTSRYNFHLVGSAERGFWLEHVNELIANLEPDSKIFEYVTQLKDLVESDKDLTEKRKKLIEMVEARYKELEYMIDNIRASLEEEQQKNT
jgi:hypothetical protein